MSSRTRTITSFFIVVMAALLLAAVVTTRIQGPAALARPADPAASPAGNAPAGRPTGPVTLDTFKEIARLQNDGVVNINTTRVVRSERSRDGFREFFGDDLMERFFGPQEGGPRSQTQTTLGSGFVIDKEGHVLTNRHVVEGADKIFVTLANGRRYDAKLVGRDARTDVALLKIEPPAELTVLNMGNSDQTEVGEWVMAIGNPFGLGGNSVTVGVVSFKGRNMNLGPQGTGVDMLQTDASINPGNSGGPLLNTEGEVIGINTMIITRGLPQSAGVGFAVPINVAKEILPQLKERGKVIRGWLGVQIQAVTQDLAQSLGLDEPRGALVSDINPDSPAAKAGLQPGDVVLSADGRKVEDQSDLSSYVASRPPGSTVKLQVWRDAKERTVSVTLGTFPDQEEDEQREASARRGQLGMTLQDLTANLAQQLELPRGTKGAVVTDIEAGSAAETAGLAPRDVIVSVNGNAVDGVDAFEAEIDKARGDGLARLRVRRGTGHLFLVLRLS
jgi:serine protease Do